MYMYIPASMITLSASALTLRSEGHSGAARKQAANSQTNKQTHAKSTRL